jgi:hypothetical protein
MAWGSVCRRSKAQLAVAALALDNLAAPGGRPAEPNLAEVPRFLGDAGPSGLAFVFHSGETSPHQLPAVMAGGVGLVDGDGDLSLRGGEPAARPLAGFRARVPR